MSFSLIICTLGERIEEFKRLINSLEVQYYTEFEIIVVTQGNHDLIAGILKDSVLNSIHLQTNIKGLSRARNLGIEKATGDYITISDDDCWYPKDSLTRVSDHLMNRSEDYDVFCFKIYDPIADRSYKEYKDKESQLTIKDIGSCSSIEIFYKNSKRNADLRFDERFGLGSIYPRGEENIFLADLLRTGNTIKYIPEYVVYHRYKERTKNMFNNTRIKTTYFMFGRIFGSTKGRLAYIYFCLRHIFKIEKKMRAILLILTPNQ